MILFSLCFVAFSRTVITQWVPRINSSLYSLNILEVELEINGTTCDGGQYPDNCHLFVYSLSNSHPTADAYDSENRNSLNKRIWMQWFVWRKKIGFQKKLLNVQWGVCFASDSTFSLAISSNTEKLLFSTIFHNKSNKD